tara:strand:+ start:5273 stop:5572 length:300 start_codon:yes stop_codon:yes gene_type:complete
MSEIDYLITFLNNNIEKLIQIYIKERLLHIDGILIIKGEKEKNNVNVFFTPKENLNNEFSEKIDKLNYTKSKAYFMILDSKSNKSLLIEKELNDNIITE